MDSLEPKNFSIKLFFVLIFFGKFKKFRDFIINFALCLQTFYTIMID